MPSISKYIPPSVVQEQKRTRVSSRYRQHIVPNILLSAGYHQTRATFVIVEPSTENGRRLRLCSTRLETVLEVFGKLVEVPLVASRENQTLYA